MDPGETGELPTDFERFKDLPAELVCEIANQANIQEIVELVEAHPGLHELINSCVRRITRAPGPWISDRRVSIYPNLEVVVPTIHVTSFEQAMELAERPKLRVANLDFSRELVKSFPLGQLGTYFIVLVAEWFQKSGEIRLDLSSNSSRAILERDQIYLDLQDLEEMIFLTQVTMAYTRRIQPKVATIFPDNGIDDIVRISELKAKELRLTGDFEIDESNQRTILRVLGLLSPETVVYTGMSEETRLGHLMNLSKIVSMALELHVAFPSVKNWMLPVDRELAPDLEGLEPEEARLFPHITQVFPNLENYLELSPRLTRQSIARS